MKIGKMTGLCAVFVLAVLFHAAAYAAEFTADMTMIKKGKKRADNYKVYVKGNMTSLDKVMMNRVKETTIYRPDKDVTWVVTIRQKMYQDFTYNPGDNPVREWTAVDEKKAIPAGSETVHGIACKKYEYTTAGGSKITIWVAEGLNYTIKSTGGDKEYELTNIKKGPVEDSKFEIPEGFYNWN